MSELHKVRVTCKRGNGLWRGGKLWPNGHTEVDLDRAAVEVLLREPLLTVAIHDGKGWRIASKGAPEAPKPTPGEPALESEVKDLEESVTLLRKQLREERDSHAAERGKLLAELADARARVTELEAQLEAATAPAAAIPSAEPPADKAKKK